VKRKDQYFSDQAKKARQRRTLILFPIFVFLLSFCIQFFYLSIDGSAKDDSTSKRKDGSDFPSVSIPRDRLPTEHPLAVYVARISEHDKNSRGISLLALRYKSPKDMVKQLLLQDRGNFHQRRLRDREDQTDSCFSGKRLPRRDFVAKRLCASYSVFSALRGGTPLLRIKIFRNRIEVNKIE